MNFNKKIQQIKPIIRALPDSCLFTVVGKVVIMKRLKLK